MQSFLDYVRLSDELYEQAYSRSKIFRETESKERQIYNHLLKVLFYNDPYNNEKHLKDIETWILDIQLMNTKSSWLTKDMFFSILYAGIEEDYHYVAWIKGYFFLPSKTAYRQAIEMGKIKLK